MKIAHYIGTLGPGGSERQLTYLARAQKSAGHQVEVFCAWLEGDTDYHFLPMLKERAIPVFQPTIEYAEKFIQLHGNMVGQLPTEIPVDVRMYSLMLAGVLAERKPDVLHCWLDLTNCAGAWAGKLAGVSHIICSFRSTNPSNYTETLYPDMTKWLHSSYSYFSKLDNIRFLANSDVVAQDYAQWLGLSPAKIGVIHNGIDFDHVPLPDFQASNLLRQGFGIPVGTPLVAGIFRLTEEKRPLDFIKVIARVKKVIPDLRVVHVGIGCMSSEFIKEAEQLGVLTCITMLGQRDDVPRILAMSDVLLHCARIEGFSNVVMESSWCHTPPVATQVGDMTQIVQNGSSGYVHSIGDIEGMAESLVELLLDPEKRKRFAEAGHKHISNKFPIQTMYQNTMLHYANSYIEDTPNKPSPKSIIPAPFHNRLKTLYLEFNSIDHDHWKALSYVVDWREAFFSNPDLDVELCNINDDKQYIGCLQRIATYDLIVVSHAATGDDMTRLLQTQTGFHGRKGKMAVFIGNEYDLLGDKIAFIRNTEAEFICTQLPIKVATWLYQECFSGAILPLPHALNPQRFKPLPNISKNTDIGFIGDIYPIWIGDIERTNLIEFIASKGHLFGLDCKIITQKLNEKTLDTQTHRVNGDDWNLFLNSCNGIIGAESGTYYLNNRGGVLRAAKEFMRAHPETSFHSLFEMFFKGENEPISGKAISSRHFEPIGTKTCQLLLEGDYNNILNAGEHYISIKRDLSNIIEAIAQFKDATYRQRIINNAYDYVMTTHTYHHRVQQLVKAVTVDTSLRIQSA